MLLVTGASGHLGSLVHAGLTRRGLAPLAGSRTPDRFGAAGRSLDFDDPATADLTGVRTLVLVSAGYGEDDVVIARHDAVITAAERAGVEHVVYTSLTAAGDHLPFALAHRWTERRLRASSLHWTVLRNGLYAELIGQLAAPADGVIATPLGDGAVAAVAREDLADAAVAVAADPESHRGSTLELVGPTAITAADLAAELAVPYLPVSLARWRAGLDGAGLLPFQPPMLLGICSAVAGGFLAGTGGDLARLLTRPARDPLRVAVAAAR
ncbi:NAD(P)H-binding protein [Umezawaea beigongshangensis]|uniref:NAD(P)H-binding protein n=1 Tax=Umezawaea beigongshangensis TaxID=2780383 RepID=UPI0018F11D1D|nr:NAD(P)H-binding protein [Umezawaea beigongshangensis]